jgi:Cys-rich protein (TIGR01571 family)
MAAPQNEDEIEAYKRMMRERYEAEQRENAEILRRRKEAEQAKNASSSSAAAASADGDDVPAPSKRRQRRMNNATKRRTISPDEMQVFKKQLDEYANSQASVAQVSVQPGSGGASASSSDGKNKPRVVSDGSYFPHNLARGTNEYMSELCSCCDDCSVLACCICVPCFLGKAKAMADGRPCSLFDACCPQCPLLTRQQMRAKFGYERAEFADCLAFVFCCPLASCQDMLEMQRRYNDVGIKWDCTGMTMTE